MSLCIFETLKRLVRLQFATVVALSFALLALPCSPLVEALQADSGDNSASTIGVVGHDDVDRNQHDTTHSFCTDCTGWLTALTTDDGLAVIGPDTSQKDSVPTALSDRRVVGLAEQRRLDGPVSVETINGTRLYAITHRYRI